MDGFRPGGGDEPAALALEGDGVSLGDPLAVPSSPCNRVRVRDHLVHDPDEAGEHGHDTAEEQDS